MRSLEPPASNRIDALRAPLFLSWQLTRDCNLACVHCCTDSAPGRQLADELKLPVALNLVAQIIAAQIPYVMLCGGEPLTAPYFWEIAEALGGAGVLLKIETNGQACDASTIARFSKLPIRSIQLSLDADTQDVYQRQRPGGMLSKVHATCELIVEAGLPLEVTFAPTRINIHQAALVIDRARALGAYRFNTGALMRLGTAARLWHKLEPTEEQYRIFREVLASESQRHGADMEISSEPFELRDGMRLALAEPPATLLVLPNGYVKVAAALPQICADLREKTLDQAWFEYRRAWHEPLVLRAVQRAIDDISEHQFANSWQIMTAS